MTILILNTLEKLGKFFLILNILLFQKFSENRDNFDSNKGISGIRLFRKY